MTTRTTKPARHHHHSRHERKTLVPEYLTSNLRHRITAKFNYERRCGTAGATDHPNDYGNGRHPGTSSRTIHSQNPATAPDQRQPQRAVSILCCPTHHQQPTRHAPKTHKRLQQPPLGRSDVSQKRPHRRNLRYRSLDKDYPPGHPLQRK